MITLSFRYNHGKQQKKYSPPHLHFYWSRSAQLATTAGCVSVEPSSCSCLYSTPTIKNLFYSEMVERSKVGDRELGASLHRPPKPPPTPSAAVLTSSADCGGETPASHSPRHIPSYQRVVPDNRSPTHPGLLHAGVALVAKRLR